MQISYELSDTELSKLKVFQDKCKQAALEKQRGFMSQEDFNYFTLGGQAPYDGAIGGSFSYIITPTSIGSFMKVRDNNSGAEEDITDYDKW